MGHDFEPRLPDKAPLMIRLADVMYTPVPCVVAKKLYIIASPEPPMYRVLSVHGDPGEAGKALRAALEKPPPGFSGDDIKSMEIWGPFDPPPAPAKPDRFAIQEGIWGPCWHECPSEWHCPRPGGPLPFKMDASGHCTPPRSATDIDSMVLLVKPKRGGWCNYNIPPLADLIVFDSGPLQKFIVPHYQKLYGPAYVEALLRRLGCA